jgi:hypothetical protein
VLLSIENYLRSIRSGSETNIKTVRFEDLTAMSTKMMFSVCREIWYKFTNVSEVFAASIIRAMRKLRANHPEN